MSISLFPYIQYPMHMFYVLFKKFSVVNNFYELQTKLSIVTHLLIHTEKSSDRHQRPAPCILHILKQVLN